MRFFWTVLLATLGPVAAFVNNAIPLPDLSALTVDAPQPVTGAGDEHSSIDFPATLLDDDSWEKLRCKGDNLIKAMHTNNVQAGKFWDPLLPSAESQWEDFRDLTDWYWHQVTDPEDTRVNFLLKDEQGWPGLGLGAALHDLGLPTQQSNDPNSGIQIISVAHADYSLSWPPNNPKYVSINDQTYNAGATTYRATGGFYKFGINTSTGAIFGLDRLAPVEAAKERKPPVPKDGLPPLQRFSDVAWLFWAKQASSKNNLKYMFSIAIANEETQKAIRRVLKNTNAAFGPWPGATFSTDSDEGKVLLGSPNGRAYGYLLAQHKPQLGGNMYISKIQVFHGETEPLIPNMVMHVEQPRPAKKRSAKRRGVHKKLAKL